MESNSRAPALEVIRVRNMLYAALTVLTCAITLLIMMMMVMMMNPRRFKSSKAVCYCMSS